MMKVFVKLYHWWYKNMQQWCFDDDFGLKSVIYGVFTIFPLFIRFSLIFMNMQIRYLAAPAM